MKVRYDRYKGYHKSLGVSFSRSKYSTGGQNYYLHICIWVGAFTIIGNKKGVSNDI